MMTRFDAEAMLDSLRCMAAGRFGVWSPSSSHRDFPDDSTPLLTFGLPWLSDEASRRWIGPRLLWWRSGIPPYRRVGIVSSRIDRRPDRERRWFDLMLTAIVRLDPESDLVVTVPSTATDEAAARTATLFGLPALTFCIAAEPSIQASERSLLAWVQERLAVAQSADEEEVPQRDGGDTTAGKLFRVDVSPEITATGIPQQPGNSEGVPAKSESVVPDLAGEPIADRLLFAASDRLVIIRGRSGGVMERLAAAHLRDTERSAVPLLVAANEVAFVKQLETIRPSGVVRWIVSSGRNSAVEPDAPATMQGGSGPAWAQTDNPLSSPGRWLCHWTRSRFGPWPDQERCEWLDELILDCDSADRSAFSALCRIVSQQRILASSDGIRGGHPVVAFTEVPLSEFRRSRVFRRHRRRFDFELYGVAVTREALKGRGARAVIYGAESDWEALPEPDRFRFQPTSKSGSGVVGPDWTAEQEWRAPGDVPLDALPPESICCFVATERARQALAAQCPWQIVVVPA